MSINVQKLIDAMTRTNLSIAYGVVTLTTAHPVLLREYSHKRRMGADELNVARVVVC